jgi:acyl-CoA dehydrogenase
MITEQWPARDEPDASQGEIEQAPRPRDEVATGASKSERDALRATAAEFVRREVVPHLQEWEDAGEIPRALHRTAGDLGLIGVAFPEEVGGGGGDLVDSVVLQEAMFDAGASSGLMAGLFTAGIALPHIAASGNADLVDRFVRPTLAGDTIGSHASPPGRSWSGGATATTTSSTAPRPSSPPASAPTS